MELTRENLGEYAKHWRENLKLRPEKDDMPLTGFVAADLLGSIIDAAIPQDADRPRATLHRDFAAALVARFPDATYLDHINQTRRFTTEACAKVLDAILTGYTHTRQSKSNARGESWSQGQQHFINAPDNFAQMVVATARELTQEAEIPVYGIPERDARLASLIQTTKQRKAQSRQGGQEDPAVTNAAAFREALTGEKHRVTLLEESKTQPVNELVMELFSPLGYTNNQVGSALAHLMGQRRGTPPGTTGNNLFKIKSLTGDDWQDLAGLYVRVRDRNRAGALRARLEKPGIAAALGDFCESIGKPRCNPKDQPDQMWRHTLSEAGVPPNLVIEEIKRDPAHTALELNPLSFPLNSPDSLDIAFNAITRLREKRQGTEKGPAHPEVVTDSLSHKERPGRTRAAGKPDEAAD